jgi:branched-chain amino acid transport system permease protein
VSPAEASRVVLQLVVDSIVSGAIYALLAFGFTITYGTLNFFNMAHGAAFAVGAYLFYVFRILLGLSLVWAIMLAVLGTALLMVAVDLIAYERLRARHAPSWAMVVSSIGVAIFIEAMISVIFGSDTLSLRTSEIRPGFVILGAVITPNQILIVVVAGALVAALTAYLEKTRAGKALRAMANDTEMGIVIGIDPRTTYMSTFALASGLAAIAGCLVALETDVYPTMGQGALLKAIVASIIGGVGSVPGAVYGGLILGCVENFAVWKLNAGWQDGISLALLLLFMLIRQSRSFVLGK